MFLRQIQCKEVYGESPEASERALVSTQEPFAKDGFSESIRTRGALRKRLKRHAAGVIFYNMKLAAVSKRLLMCGRDVVPAFMNVDLVVDRTTGRARFRGLMRCGCIWACPDCAAHISAIRRTELEHLLRWSRKHGYSVVHLTLTARHDRKMPLAAFLSGLKKAKQKMRRHRSWAESVKPVLIGSVTATEVTLGVNGWHPHFHEIIVLKGTPDQAEALIEGQRANWLASLAAVRLSGNEHAFNVQDASAAGSYVTKFGLEDEMVGHGTKKGRNGSVTPQDLLEMSMEGDMFARARWIEFMEAFHGRRQLVWSPGLKKLAGVEEQSDEDALQADSESEDIIRSWPGRSQQWHAARQRSAALLDAAEVGDDLDAAEFGPTDDELWHIHDPPERSK